jgi:hypothetical protein
MADLNSCLKYRRDGKLTFAQWLRSFKGIQEYAFFAWDDMKPFWKHIGDTILGVYLRLSGKRSRMRTPERPCTKGQVA